MKILLVFCAFTGIGFCLSVNFSPDIRGLEVKVVSGKNGTLPEYKEVLDDGEKKEPKDTTTPPTLQKFFEYFSRRYRLRDLDPLFKFPNKTTARKTIHEILNETVEHLNTIYDNGMETIEKSIESSPLYLRIHPKDEAKESSNSGGKDVVPKEQIEDEYNLESNIDDDIANGTDEFLEENPSKSLELPSGHKSAIENILKRSVRSVGGHSSENKDSISASGLHALRQTQNTELFEPCVPKSALDEHVLNENQKIRIIEDELKKLKDLILILRDQQHVLDLLNDIKLQKLKHGDGNHLVNGNIIEDENHKLQKLLERLRIQTSPENFSNNKKTDQKQGREIDLQKDQNHQQSVTTDNPTIDVRMNQTLNGEALVPKNSSENELRKLIRQLKDIQEKLVQVTGETRQRNAGPAYENAEGGLKASVPVNRQLYYQRPSASIGEIPPQPLPQHHVPYGPGYFRQEPQITMQENNKLYVPPYPPQNQPFLGPVYRRPEQHLPVYDNLAAPDQYRAPSMGRNPQLRFSNSSESLGNENPLAQLRTEDLREKLFQLEEAVKQLGNLNDASIEERKYAENLEREIFELREEIRNRQRLMCAQELNNSRRKRDLQTQNDDTENLANEIVNSLSKIFENNIQNDEDYDPVLFQRYQDPNQMDEKMKLQYHIDEMKKQIESIPSPISQVNISKVSPPQSSMEQRSSEMAEPQIPIQGVRSNLEQDSSTDQGRSAAAPYYPGATYPYPYSPQYDQKAYTHVKHKKPDLISSIIEKIFDKIIDLIPTIIKRLVGDFIDGAFYSTDVYGYQDGGYAIQQKFKSFGLLGYIPLVIINLLSSVSYFFRILQRNKFIRNFLVPIGVIIAVTALVAFLVFWFNFDAFDSIDQSSYKQINHANGGKDYYGYNSYQNQYHRQSTDSGIPEKSFPPDRTNFKVDTMIQRPNAQIRYVL